MWTESVRGDARAALRHGGIGGAPSLPQRQRRKSTAAVMGAGKEGEGCTENSGGKEEL